MSFFGSFFKRDKKKATPKPESNNKQEQSITSQGWLMPGSLVGSGYEVYDELGHGGFGVVYRVYSHETKDVVALKTFKDEFIEDVETKQLFRREANVWVDLERHPYLVRAYFVTEVSGRLYIAIEYIAPNKQGLNTLEGYLEHQPPDLIQSLRWTIQFCHGMEYAYSKGLHCHRDIKPANILITQDKIVKISDFGLAGVLGASKTSGARLNVKQGKVGLSTSIMDGKGYGTPPYMPPEQFTNAANCDQRSDIYAFGVVLYQMATCGKLPFLATLPKDDSEEAQARFSREMYSLHSHAIVPYVDSPLFPIIQRCLEKQPTKRYQTFRELRADLEPLLKRQNGETVRPPEQKELVDWEWAIKGFSLDSLGRFEEAIDCYDKALEIDPKCAIAWNNKGRTLESLGHFDESIKCYSKALEINPQYDEAWYGKGNGLHSLGRFEDAIVCYDKTLKINPQYTAAWTNKGGNLAELRRFEEAIICYDKALEMDTQDTVTWNMKGNSFRGLGRFEKAFECYDKSLKINPRDVVAWYNKGATECEVGRKLDAIKSLRIFIELAPPEYNKEVEAIKRSLKKLEGR